MIFEASLDSDNSLIFVTILNIINDFIENIQIEINENGFHVFGFDSSQILYIDLNLYFSFFKDFFIEKKLLVCFKIDYLNKYLKNLNKSALESIILGYDNNDSLLIRVIKNNGSISNFKVPELYSEVKDQYDLPSVEYHCEVLLPSKLLGDICNELKIFKDYNLIINADKSSLNFKVSDELSSVDIHLERKKTKEFEIICKNNISIEFKNKYFLKINNMVKKIGIKECLLQIGENLPLSIHFSITPQSTFQFYLAPLLE